MGGQSPLSCLCCVCVLRSPQVPPEGRHVCVRQAQRAAAATCCRIPPTPNIFIGWGLTRTQDDTDASEWSVTGIRRLYGELGLLLK